MKYNLEDTIKRYNQGSGKWNKLAEKLPGLDAIAIGPQINHCHTPDEELDLASLERTFRLLSAVLARLAE